MFGTFRYKALCVDDRQIEQELAHNKKCGSLTFFPLVPWKEYILKIKRKKTVHFVRRLGTYPLLFGLLFFACGKSKERITAQQIYRPKSRKRCRLFFKAWAPFLCFTVQRAKFGSLGATLLLGVVLGPRETCLSFYGSFSWCQNE